MSGQGMVEYIIIVIVVAIVVLAAIRLFGKSVLCQFAAATRQIDDDGDLSGLPEECRPNVVEDEDDSPPPPPHTCVLFDKTLSLNENS